MRCNLSWRDSIRTECRLDDLDGWFLSEISQSIHGAEQTALMVIQESLDQFVSWPEKALLMWQGCTRREKYFSYPLAIKELARSNRIVLDGRTNGPAVSAYLLSGGKRPPRVGSRNAWSIHHLYSGKFPYVGRDITMRAAIEGNHFTQSAGLVAVHPIADAICDEYPAFSWLLRAKAYMTFGYDPEGVFSSNTSVLGFSLQKRSEVIQI